MKKVKRSKKDNRNYPKLVLSGILLLALAYFGIIYSWMLTYADLSDATVYTQIGLWIPPYGVDGFIVAFQLAFLFTLLDILGVAILSAIIYFVAVILETNTPFIRIFFFILYFEIILQSVVMVFLGTFIAVILFIIIAVVMYMLIKGEKML